jgi:hypothetical protein
MRTRNNFKYLPPVTNFFQLDPTLKFLSFPSSVPPVGNKAQHMNLWGTLCIPAITAYILEIRHRSGRHSNLTLN